MLCTSRWISKCGSTDITVSLHFVQGCSQDNAWITTEPPCAGAIWESENDRKRKVSNPDHSWASRHDYPWVSCNQTSWCMWRAMQADNASDNDTQWIRGLKRYNKANFAIFSWEQCRYYYHSGSGAQSQKASHTSSEEHRWVRDLAKQGLACQSVETVRDKENQGSPAKNQNKRNEIGRCPRLSYTWPKCGIAEFVGECRLDGQQYNFGCCSQRFERTLPEAVSAKAIGW